MKILRKICSAVLCAAVAVFMVCSLAEGKEKAGALSSEDFVPADTVAVSDIIEGLTARSAVVTEMTTGTSRRSEPSSRATLMGEQPNPWDLLQPQDVTSRHRGAKPLRRYELLGAISLLSPEYLLSFERWPFHAEPPDHYALVSNLIDVSVSQSSTLMPLHSADDYQTP